ncbi:MAG: adenosylcobalamin-dependent ribonucleoside-diphosphate reductase [Planctomycetota bacterium]
MAAAEIKLTPNAETVLQHRYLAKDERGEVVETPEEMFRRVAGAVAAAEERFGESPDAVAGPFFEAMSRLDFLPNSPTLMNAGTSLGQMSACFVLPVPDSIDGIFTAVKQMAIVHQSGGGTGFAFSRLRPRDDIVRSTGGIASGPVSFLRVFDMATDVIKQGGRRRGANMGVLRVDHPDIRDFIRAKVDTDAFRNFNLSVAVTDRFLAAVADADSYPLINPRSGEEAGREDARDVLDQIVDAAWQCGDPGLAFLDEINRKNPLPRLGDMESTNPCGEQPLLPYESCVLGSINLLHVLRGGEVDWERLADLVRLGVRFLDDVIEVQRYPIDEVKAVTRRNRKIGLGVMGFADLLIRLGIPYASDEALELGGRTMQFITERGREASAELAERRGAFETFEGSRWDEAGLPPLRNATITTVAPTGTISIIAGVSSGIEPVFALSYSRRVLDGRQLREEHPLFVEDARRRGFYSAGLMEEVARRGSVQAIDGVPDDVKERFACALDIDPIWHVRMQAAFQKHTDNAVSKTVNLPPEATRDDIKAVYLRAHELGCKGITIYRYGCKAEQTLSVPGMPRGKEGECAECVELGAEEDGGCRECAT